LVEIDEEVRISRIRSFSRTSDERWIPDEYCAQLKDGINVVAVMELFALASTIAKARGSPEVLRKVATSGANRFIRRAPAKLQFRSYLPPVRQYIYSHPAIRFPSASTRVVYTRKFNVHRASCTVANDCRTMSFLIKRCAFI